MSSFSLELLSKQDTLIEPQKWEGDALTIRVWALLCFEKYINEVGWIDHTCDWDLAYEVTVDDKTYFSTEVTPLNVGGEPYTGENGVNEQIVSLRLDDWWDADTGSNDEPKIFQLSEVSRIYFG